MHALGKNRGDLEACRSGIRVSTASLPRCCDNGHWPETALAILDLHISSSYAELGLVIP